MEVLTLFDTEVVAHSDTDSSVHTHEGFLEGPMTLPCSLDMEIMWNLDYAGISINILF